MKKIIFGILIIIICLGFSILDFDSASAVSGLAQDPSRDLYSARQLGMGGVSVNFANDASGVFANPACLNGLQFPQLTSSSRKLLMDETQYLLAGWAMPTNYGIFGVGYAAMGTGDSLPTMLDPATGRIIQNPSLEAGSFANSDRKIPRSCAAANNFSLHTF